jgi:PAS domain S-box-containing protein
MVAAAKFLLAPWGQSSGELAAMTRLQELSEILTATADLSLVLQEVLNATMELQRAEFGDIQLFNPRTQKLEIATQHGFAQEILDHFRYVDVDTNSTCGLALRQRHRIISADVRRDPRFLELRPIAARAGFRAMQSTPLFEHGTGNLVGMISTHFRRPRRLAGRELRLTDLYARQAADVIAFRLAEQRLRENEEHLRLALEAAHMGTWEWDPVAGVFQSDAAHQALFGIPVQNPPPPCKAYFARMAPEDISRSIERAKYALQHHSEFEMQQRILGPGGEIRWTQSMGRPRDGDHSRMIGVSFDITERVHEAQALRESEARLKAAVNLGELGLYSWNPQTNEMVWDDATWAMWGLPPQTPMDYQSWFASIHRDDQARVLAAIECCTDPAGEGVYDVEYRVTGTGDGSERWIATRGRMQFEGGKPVRLYGVVVNTTSRKELEAALERRVEERTRALENANRELRQQIGKRESAEAAVQKLQRLDAIGQITSGVAHDFNNLLAIIQINARLLARASREPFDQESVDLILGAAESGRRLTAQLVAFARKQDLLPRSVDLNSEIAEMHEMLIVTLGGAAHLETSLAPDLWPALVDPTQIESIVLNLAINARDAMEPGGTLSVETANVVIHTDPVRSEGPSPGDYVVLSVKDTGVGIPTDVLHRIFEPFYTTKEPGRGSGLGLAQVLGIAKQSGGGVTVDTRMGEGTLVNVFLPRARHEVDSETEPCFPLPDLPLAGTVRILVVDDNHEMLVSTGRMLFAHGFSTVLTGSGDEALLALEQEPDLDLLLVDFAMPGMSGTELLRVIHDRTPDLPAILVTGHADLEVPRYSDRTRFLRKPFSLEQLLSLIASALR